MHLNKLFLNRPKGANYKDDANQRPGQKKHDGIEGKGDDGRGIQEERQLAKKTGATTQTSEHWHRNNAQGSIARPSLTTNWTVSIKN